MKITVSVHPAASIDMARWRLLPPGKPVDRQSLLRHYVRDIVATVVRSGGVVPDAVPVGTIPNVFGWQYSTDLWVLYAVRDRRRLMRTERHVMILRLAERPLDRLGP